MITSGGIIGVVERVMEDDRIEVIIGESTKVQIIRSTITSLLKKEEVKNNFFVLNFSKINIILIYLIFSVSLFSLFLILLTKIT